MQQYSSDQTWADYMAVLQRRWRLAFVAGFLVFLGSIYIAFSLPALYTSSATMLIEEQGIPSDFVQTTVDAYAEELLQTIYQTVVAGPNVIALIDKFDLYPDERGRISKEDLLNLFRDGAEMTPQNVVSINARTGREAIVTFGFKISFTYPDPTKARDVADELADLFVAHNSRLRAEAAARATAFLDAESAQIQDRLSEVASKIAEFKQRNPGNLPEDQATNIETLERLRFELTRVEDRQRDAVEQKALLESELSATPRYRPTTSDSGDPIVDGIDLLAEKQRELIRLRGRYNENHPAIVNLRREIEALSSTAGDNEAAIVELRSQLAAKNSELQSARETYTSSHPDITRLERDVELINQQLRVLEQQNSGQVAYQPPPTNPVYLQYTTRIDAASTELSDLERQKTVLNRRILEIEQRRIGFPQVEREYSALVQEQDLLMAQYRELRSLEDEAALGEALETGQSGQRFRIIEEARVPSNPVSPDRLSLGFLGFVLAIAVALVAVSISEALDTKVRGQRDVAVLLNMPPIGVIPYVESRPDILKRRSINSVTYLILLAVTAMVVVKVLL